MNLIENFTHQEWTTLQFSFIWMFQAIASADGKIDVGELDAMNFIQQKADTIQNQLAKEILKSMNVNFNEVSVRYQMEPRTIRTGLRETAIIIENKLEHDDAVDFKKTLLAIGAFIANSSGDMLSSMISNEESQTLTELSLYMKLTKEEFRSSPTMIEIMESFTK